MRQKKYQLDTAPKRATTSRIPNRNPWVVQTTATLDFRRWRTHHGTNVHAERDDLLKTMAACLQRLTSTATAGTVNSIYRGALQLWFEFLDSDRVSNASVQRITDINRALLEDFLFWLQKRPAKTKSGRLSYSTARTCYVGLRSVLLQCVATGQLRMDCFPRKPFPDVARTHKPHLPYTREEMQSLMAALARDLQEIRAETFAGNDSDRLLIYFLLIAARTGRNPTSLYEMERDAVQPHPLKPDTHVLLTTYKRRGNTVSIQSIKNSPGIEHISILAADASTLLREVMRSTSALIDEVPASLKNRLWLYRRHHRLDLGSTGVFSNRVLYDSIGRFVTRHHLVARNGDAGSKREIPLTVTIMRLRKTFASRMWELTGGDLTMTANMLGNRPHVTDTHYLAVTPEMMRNHHFVGRCLEVELRGTSKDIATLACLAKEMQVDLEEMKRIIAGDNNTGVGRCSSPLNGRYAPKDGNTACSAFLYCFRCPNQVIMESDLYRLFSFYWLLVKERNLMGRNRWHKVYGSVVREIDRVIAPHFSSQAIRQAKEKAFVDPHPMWRDRSMLLSRDHA